MEDSASPGIVLRSGTQMAIAATDFDFFTVRLADRQTGLGVPFDPGHTVPPFGSDPARPCVSNFRYVGVGIDDCVGARR